PAAKMPHPVPIRRPMTTEPVAIDKPVSAGAPYRTTREAKTAVVNFFTCPDTFINADTIAPFVVSQSGKCGDKTSSKYFVISCNKDIPAHERVDSATTAGKCLARNRTTYIIKPETAVPTNGNICLAPSAPCFLGLVSIPNIPGPLVGAGRPVILANPF